MTSKELLSRPLEGTSVISNILKTISETSSKLDKMKLFKEAPVEFRETIDMIFADTYGPAKYYIKAYDIEGVGTKSIDTDYYLFHGVLTYLADRVVTGKAAAELVSHIISLFDSSSQVILARVLDKNLKIGLADAGADSAGVTSKFPVRLANVYKDVADRVDVFDGTWLVSRKLDGCRCLAFVNADERGVDVVFRSRQNKEFTTLDVLKESYKQFFAGKTGRWVVDGEVCIMDGDTESFHGLMAEIRRKNHTIEHPMHIVYDLLSEDEFWGRTESEPLTARLTRFADIFMERPIPHISMLEQVPLESNEQLSEMLKKARESDWEGLMLAKDVPYEGKRSNNLLKVKDFRDGEYVVLGVETGSQARNCESGTQMVETTAALVIEHKGNRVQVGTGMTWAQRDRWYAHPDDIIGKTIQVRYFEETVDRKTGLASLRFPTLNYIYENGREE